jgi:Putative zinc-finger
MNPINQSATHPDTESLNAFAEQALPPTEREQILAHMATCGRCRQVVYLAQQAGVGPLEPGVVLPPQPQAPRRSWLTSWHVAWIPAAALAGLIGFAILHHSQRVSQEAQMARNTPPLAASLAPPPQPNLQTQNKSAPSTAREDAPLAEEKQALRKPSPPHVAAPSTPKILQKDEGASFGAGGGRAGASFGNELASGRRLDALQKPSSLGGPMAANQLQQQNANANQQQQSPRQQLNNASLAALGSSRTESSGDKKETKGVSADAVSTNGPTPAPAPMAQLEVAPSLTGRNLSTLKAKAAKTATILPNGVAALSIATAAGRTIAVDPSGNLFVIESPGSHWIPVSPQWTGRAIFLRAYPMPAASAGSLAASSPAPSTPLFELMNDKIQTWISFDGKVWQAQTPPAK